MKQKRRKEFNGSGRNSAQCEGSRSLKISFIKNRKKILPRESISHNYKYGYLDFKKGLK